MHCLNKNTLLPHVKKLLMTSLLCFFLFFLEKHRSEISVGIKKTERTQQNSALGIRMSAVWVNNDMHYLMVKPNKQLLYQPDTPLLKKK